MFYEKQVDLRSRNAMTGFLTGHFSYCKVVDEVVMEEKHFRRLVCDMHA